MRICSHLLFSNVILRYLLINQLTEKKYGYNTWWLGDEILDYIKTKFPEEMSVCFF